MKIRIQFPDGRIEYIDIDISDCDSIECIAEKVARHLAEKYCETVGCRNEERVVYSYLSWVYPQIYTAIIEMIEGK